MFSAQFFSFFLLPDFSPFFLPDFFHFSGCLYFLFYSVAGRRDRRVKLLEAKHEKSYMLRPDSPFRVFFEETAVLPKQGAQQRERGCAQIIRRT